MKLILMITAAAVTFLVIAGSAVAVQDNLLLVLMPTILLACSQMDQRRG